MKTLKGKEKFVSTPRQVHETELVAIKTVPVDKIIAPVVRWLNSFEGIMTRWSCEGMPFNTPSGVIFSEPYVIFYCDKSIDLMKIIPKLSRAADIILEFDEFHGGLRYNLRFKSIATLEKFVKEEIIVLEKIKEKDSDLLLG